MRGKRASYEEFWALRDVSFDIPVGSTFGLIGENGSGKSTMLKCVAQILQPDHGQVVTHGRIAALLELGSGFHQELSGRENVFLNGSILGLTRKELERKFDEIVDFAGIEEFIDQPVKNYSSGHVRPAGLRDRDQRRPGDPAGRRGARGRRRRVPGEVHGQVRRLPAARARRWSSSATPWGRCGRCATRRSGCEHGKLMRAGKANEIVDDYMDASFTSRATTAVEVVDIAAPADPEDGTGVARITAVEMLNADGERRDRFRTGDKVTLRMSYQADTPVPEANVGYAVDDLHGTHVWSFRTTEGGLEMGTMTGSGSVDLVIPALPLQANSFVLNASIRGSNGHLIHRIRAIISFHVDPGTPRESGGLVVFGAHWANHRQAGTVTAAPAFDA